MKWFQVKEQSAGRKRLVLTWYLYKIFGKNILYVIAFLMSVFTYIFSPCIRKSSKNYLSTVQNYTGLKPSAWNVFRHILAYADSLADKILVFCGDFGTDNLLFESEEKKKQMFDDINKGEGCLFICNHIGNIEVLQSFFFNEITNPDFSINIFLSKNHSQIFNGFLNDIKKEIPVNIYPVEDLGPDTGIELKESLDKGGVVFIAGDRLARDNDDKSIEALLFGHQIHLPLGVYKLAKLMKVPTYFISALRNKGGKYKIYLEKQDNLTEEIIVKNYVDFLQKMTLLSPFQFFHFYDFFR